MVVCLGAFHLIVIPGFQRIRSIQPSNSLPVTVDQIGVDEMGVDKTGVDETGVDEMGTYVLIHSSVFYWDTNLFRGSG